VQHGEHGDSTADVTWIAGEFDDRGGTGLHQHTIAVTLMRPQQLTQLGRHGDGDVEVWHLSVSISLADANETPDRQHLCLPVFEPLTGLRSVALGAAAVATGMV
jgi:hypothetical protein